MPWCHRRRIWSSLDNDESRWSCSYGVCVVLRRGWIDGVALARFVLACQDADDGGVADRPGNMAGRRVVVVVGVGVAHRAVITRTAAARAIGRGSRVEGRRRHDVGTRVGSLCFSPV